MILPSLSTTFVMTSNRTQLVFTKMSPFEHFPVRKHCCTLFCTSILDPEVLLWLKLGVESLSTSRANFLLLLLPFLPLLFGAAVLGNGAKVNRKEGGVEEIVLKRNKN